MAAVKLGKDVDLERIHQMDPGAVLLACPESEGDQREPSTSERGAQRPASRAASRQREG